MTFMQTNKQTNKQTSKQTKKLVFISKNEWINDNEVAPQRKSFFLSQNMILPSGWLKIH